MDGKGKERWDFQEDQHSKIIVENVENKKKNVDRTRNKALTLDNHYNRTGNRNLIEKDLKYHERNE